MKYILTPFLWLVGQLPIWAMKAISSSLAWINWNVIRYRKNVVLNNLQKAFPNKSAQEYQKIARNFYIQFCDYILSLIRIRYNKSHSLNRTITHKNPEVLQSLSSQGKSGILVTGHYFSWEYVNTTPLVCDHLITAAYHPLSNRFADELVKFCRQKYGAELHPMNEIYRTLVKYRKENMQTMTLMVADQSPTANNLEHWITFLGQDTPVLIGPEHIASKLGLAVVYLKTIQRKRFVYEYEYVLITDNAAGMEPLEVTKRWYAELEQQIRTEPERYLWSHRRWKHQDKKPV